MTPIVEKEISILHRFHEHLFDYLCVLAVCCCDLTIFFSSFLKSWLKKNIRNVPWKFNRQLWSYIFSLSSHFFKKVTKGSQSSHKRREVTLQEYIFEMSSAIFFWKTCSTTKQQLTLFLLAMERSLGCRLESAAGPMKSVLSSQSSKSAPV